MCVCVCACVCVCRVAEKRRLGKADAGEMYGNGMQYELFDIFQKHRGMVMRWLIQDKTRCNEVRPCIAG